MYLQIAKDQYSDPEKQGYYNVGPDECDCVNTGELVTLFCKRWRGNLKWINRYDGGPHEAAFLKLDNSKIKEVFDWSPRWHINETIQRIVEWLEVYLEDKGKIPSEMDREIELFINKGD